MKLIRQSSGLRFGYTVKKHKDGVHNVFVPNRPAVYCCRNAGLTEDVGVLSGCGFSGSLEEVKKHQFMCERDDK